MKQVKIDGRPFCLDTRENRETAILLHTAASSDTAWAKAKAALSPHYRVVVPDFSTEEAFPGSSSLSEAFEKETKILRDLIEASGNPAHVIAHSYGGVIALNLARKTSRLLTSLTLIEPMALNLLSQYPGNEELLRLHAVKSSCSSALAEGDFSGAARTFVSYWSGAKTWENLSISIRKVLAKRMTKFVSDWERMGDVPSGFESYASVQPPTLVISGSESPQPIQWVARQLTATLKHAKLLQIESAGHMSPVTHGSRIAVAILEHLNKSSAFANAHHFEGNRIWPEKAETVTQPEANTADDIPLAPGETGWLNPAGYATTS